MLTLKTYADPGASRQSNKFINCQSSYVPGRVSAQIRHHSSLVLKLRSGIERFDLLLLTANIHCNFIVDQDADHRSSLRIESEAEGVETWSIHDNHSSILLPEEIVRAGVDCLDLPWHHI